MIKFASAGACEAEGRGVPKAPVQLRQRHVHEFGAEFAFYTVRLYGEVARLILVRHTSHGR